MQRNNLTYLLKKTLNNLSLIPHICFAQLTCVTRFKYSPVNRNYCSIIFKLKQEITNEVDFKVKFNINIAV